MENNMDLMEQISRAMMLLHRYQHHSRKEQVPITDPLRGQGRILVLLKRQMKISQKDISYFLDMKKQSLSELLTKMEKAGLISRTQSETDRRVMNIELTKAGIDAAIQVEQGKQDYCQIFNCLSEEERKTLSGYLARIIIELETKMGSEADLSGGWGQRGMLPVLLRRLRESSGLTQEMLEDLKRT